MVTGSPSALGRITCQATLGIRSKLLFSTAFLLLLIAALASPILPPPAATARPEANCDSALMVCFSSSVNSLASLPP